MAKTKLKKLSALINEARETSKTKTATKNIAVDIRGETFYISKPLVKGNSKLDSGVMIFDLPAGYSCPNCSGCLDSCYALSAQRQYPGCRVKRTINYMLARDDAGRAQLFDLICKQLRSTRKYSAVRIHSSGDFFSVEYARLWCDIARAFPGVKFYTYTKTGAADMLRAAGINVVDSILPNGLPNYGTEEYIKTCADMYNCAICPATLDSGKNIKCGRDCSACINTSGVVFKAHGIGANNCSWCAPFLETVKSGARVFMMKQEA